MNNLWIKFGCFLIGWNYKILSGCTEASFKQVKKYTSALVLLLILWGFIGYSFANKYLNLGVFQNIVVAIAFILIVIQIERQIILTVGKNYWLGIFRFIIALIMAILGSAIIDQFIFKDDIEKRMIQIVDSQVNNQIGARVKLINDKITGIEIELEDLNEKNFELQDDIAKKPTINTISALSAPVTLRRADGSDTVVYRVTKNEIPIVNPKIKQVEANYKQAEQLRGLLESYNEKRLWAESSLRDELKSKQGFLEELTATVSILSESVVGLVFYLILFSFFVALELFIVFGKLFDSKSDYDLIIEHQLSQKLKTLEKLIKN
jgi:hypothetical protein